MLLVSDFNLQNFTSFLVGHKADLGDTHTIAPLGQVTQTLLDDQSPMWHPPPEVCLVWTRPEAVLPTFRRVLEGHPLDLSALDQEVDAFAHCLQVAAGRVSVLLVASWCLPPIHSGHGLLDLSSRDGAARLLMMANLRLLSALDGTPSVFVLNSDRWLSMTGLAGHSPRLWYGAKIPFSNELFRIAAGDVASALRGIRGRSRKLILLDLDDTLWGGIVGDVGWQNVVLGGHDPIGEALLDFQRELKALSRRGIALGILSKNQEEVALDAIRQHPEMALRLDDFAGWRINWEDKAKNLEELVSHLNLGLDSVVFIDDNPAERGRVREAFPQVLVPEWPADKRLYPHALLSLDCFDRPYLTEEDRQRTNLYQQERRRTEMRQSVSSVEDWLASLELSLTVTRLTQPNLSRLTQLLNKTNQMNMTTRRMGELELQQWASAEQRALWGIRVSDRFGDYGLTGLLSVEAEAGVARVVDFVLSCRVMGRRVEEAMLHIAVEWAREMGLVELHAQYRATPRNHPCLEFLRRSGLQDRGDATYVWPVEQAYPLNEYVKLVFSDESTPLSVGGD